MIALLAAADVFVPDGDEARRRAQEELSKPEYQAAKPNWFDQLAADVADWFFGLFDGDGTGAVAPLALTMITIVVVAAVVVALLVWGRPRASRAMRGRADLLGEKDDRSAAQLRTDAERRAREGDWDGAVVLRFRALARGLLERDLIDPAPGATAQGIAREAAPALPQLTQTLHEAATLFDAVRYLGAPASEADYRTLAAADDRVRNTAPRLTADAGTVHA
ncbi:DUF4129 domain-containing protein [Microbacterium sp. nov. GSS16]|uniref:DUF4129 domain-containing protein n=1 Tax=Microbacterium sp. nov. GSS16 TaxID=3019890 RepID=UPI002304FA6B|nr:DUF4129 domain-containing protein [Microbacterium sp. nov. GSS16]WCD92514.1 DUF4129 domain-containing protein [Microbacterium sp. nov. GSS16]